MKKIIYMLLLGIAAPVGLLILFYYIEAGLLAICLYAFVFIMYGSWMMVHFWLRPLKCERVVSDEVVRIGDGVRVVLKIRNPYPWPILWAYVEESLPRNMPKEGTTKRLLFLPPRRTFHLYYSIKIMHRGCHQLGPLIVETGDVFGLFRKSRLDKKRDFVTAVPEYKVIEEFKVGQRRWLGDFTAKRSLIEDPTRIRGIRDYRRGDALKRIHWKSTAHTGRLLSKLYDPVVVAGATVILDFRRDSWKDNLAAREDEMPSQEIAIQAACSICRYLWDGGWKLGFFSNGRDPLGLPGVTLSQAKSSDSLTQALEAARMGIKDDRLEPISIRAKYSRDQFTIIHENLGRIALSDGLPIESVLMGELPYIERQQVLVVLTGDVSDSFISGMLRVRALGYRMMVFVVRNTVAHDRAFEALAPSGIEVYDLEHERRLSEIATGRRFL